jgi:pimeloyl-ACP methyl ester carboxylesterase
VPGLGSFDLSVPGGSLAADLARAGHRVFIMDARGYGGSTRPAAMIDPPEANPPLVRSEEVVRDIGAVVAAIRARAARTRIALLGWATGGHWLGQYASLDSGRVSHLVIYNALYGRTPDHPSLGHGSSLEDPERPGRAHGAGLGADRLNSAAALASDLDSDRHAPPAFRAPSGALEDSYYLAIGRQFWDASLITATTLVIRSERDFWSRPDDLGHLIDDLDHAARADAIEIPGATHFVHLDRPERGRRQFLEAVLTFLS